MAVISTSTHTLSNVVKQEYLPDMAYCRELVIVNGPAATLAIGTVLGKVTATGKYKVSIQTAIDGSEVPAAVVFAETVVPATTDTEVLSIIRGPASVSATGLVLDASYNDAAKKAAAYAGLEAVGIQVLETV